MEKEYSSVYKNKKVFVTGAAGFIGSNLAKKLLDLGARVIGVDDFSAGNKSNVTDILGHKNLEFIKDDFVNVALPEDIDYIFHLAVRNISMSEIDPVGAYTINVLGLKKLISKAEKIKNLKRFIFPSSSSIYGNPNKIPTGEDAFELINLFCHYTKQKYEIEQTLIVSEVPYSIVRLTNTYGPKQTNENPYCGVLGRWIFDILDEKTVGIIGDGQQTRDFIYVDDVVDACLLVAGSPDTVGCVYNVGTGREISIILLSDIIRKVCLEYKINATVKRILPRSIDFVRRRCLSIKKIESVIGWQPIVNLEEGVKRTFRWAFDFSYKKRYGFRKIGVSVPAYMEESLIVKTLKKIPTWVDFITVVNDCSLDDTSKAARSVKDNRIVVIDHKKNEGVGGAIMTAHKENVKRGADILVVMAGDGQMAPEYLPALLDSIFFESYDYAKGNRFKHIKELKTMPKYRLIGNIIMTIIAKITTGYWDISDPLNGYTAITKEMFCRLNLNRLSRRHDFELSILTELNINEAEVKDIPIPALYGEEKSKIVLWNIAPLALINMLKNFIRRVLIKYL